MEDFNINIKSKMIIFCLILCILFTVSSVCASEDVNATNQIITSSNIDTTAESLVTNTNNNNDMLSVGADNTQYSASIKNNNENQSNTLYTKNNDVLGVNNNDEQLRDDTPSSTGSLKDLWTQIENTPTGGTLTLTTDYTFKDNLDAKNAYIGSIDRAMTINGNGHIIDGNNKTCLLLNMVNGVNNVIIKNINFKNFYTSYNQESCLLQFQNAANCSVYNCTFTSCGHKHWGGAIKIGTIYITDSYVENITVDKCNFTNMIANVGGAIYVAGHSGSHVVHVNITNCNFKQCKITSSGGRGSAIEFNAQYGLIEDCTFIDNNANVGSGTIGLYSTATYATIKNCTFINNTAKQGGAISSEQEACHDTLITGCTFINNQAANGNGGAVVFYASNSNITYCNFINNSAKEGGAVQFKASNGYMGFCNYTNNTATVDGGALCANAAGSTVENCSFEGNSAPDGPDFYAHGTYKITFKGLKFSTLYLTNENSTGKIYEGYGTNWKRPARWNNTDRITDFINLQASKITIYPSIQ